MKTTIITLILFIIISASSVYACWSTGPELRWESVNNADSYNVRYGFIKGGPYHELFKKQTARTRHKLSNLPLVPGITYYFVVTAVNKVGESGYSNEVEYKKVEKNEIKNMDTVSATRDE